MTALLARFRPRRLGLRSRITLTFDARNFTLRTWRIRDPQGNDTFVSLSNIDAAARPNPAKFRINYQRDIGGGATAR